MGVIAQFVGSKSVGWGFMVSNFQSRAASVTSLIMVSYLDKGGYQREKMVMVSK